MRSVVPLALLLLAGCTGRLFVGVDDDRDTGTSRFDAGDFDAGDFDAGDFDAGGFDAAGFDAAGFDAGDTPTDAGPMGTDAGPTGTDSGPTGTDAGPPPTDAGTDSGPPPSDAGGLPPHCSSGPLALPIAGCRPSVLPSTGDPAEDCVRRINQLRAECQCLGPLARWTAGESCAEQHAEYDSMTGVAHSGFSAGICSPGGRGQNECPGWGSVSSVISGCLQSMWDEGPGTPFSAHGHYINMTNPSHARVACGFYTTSGGRVWAVQNFSN